MICGGSSFGCGGAGNNATLGGVIRIETPYRHPTVSENFYKILKKEYPDYFKLEKEEKSTMKVTYNGFAGELVKLERTHYGESRYSLSLYDGDKNVTHSFTHVKLEDVTFSGGVITFGG